MAIATAAKQVMVDGMQTVVAGGQENITAVQKAYFDAAIASRDLAVERQAPHAYMPMLQTAEFVARKYGIGRDAQDAFALESQRRTAQAQALGRFDREIVPVTTTMAVTDKATGAISLRQVTLDRDEGNRADTTLEGLAKLQPVKGPGKFITAGNASPLTDGGAAVVLMADEKARALGYRRIVSFERIKP